MDPPRFSSQPSSLTQPLPRYTVDHPNPNPNSSSSDLLTTISLIHDLALLAESTLKSVSDFLFSTPPSPSSVADLALCPFDFHHHMPLESLFRHSLSCPSAPGAHLSDLGFLDNLRYPKSLKSHDQLLKESLFDRPLPETEADICFSLESELGEIGSNFFYKDCPGVVTSPEPDAANRTFTLPAILSSECANFMKDDPGEGAGDLEQTLGIFPSEFCALKSELEVLRDFPASYSYVALRVAARLDTADELSLKRWVILNSPKIGILIDAAMRDHVYLLLKLCLKAVRREAVGSLKLVVEKKGFLDPRGACFECRKLVSSLTWLASQISVLYGGVNGKFFVMGMLKESFLLAGRSLMLFRMEKENVMSDEKVVSGSECSDKEYKLDLSKSAENVEVKVHKTFENSCSNKVFVSQIAAAIAALHERFLLEQTVKELRFNQPLPRFQLINKYVSTSIRASQERAKRLNYRPLLEHDGLLWQRSNMQDFGKSKTREQLLAEERDYKRRRMSYRGKKVKRNPTQVLHDIIEEHMEEIKQAGGIGCNIKIASESNLFPKLGSDRNKDHELQYGAKNAYVSRISKSLHYASPNSHEYDYSNGESSISCLQKTDQEIRLEHLDDQYKLKKNRQERGNYSSRSPSYHSGYSRSSERDSQLKNQTNRRPHRDDNYDRGDSVYPRSYKNYDSRSVLTSKSQRATEREFHCVLESRRRHSSRVSEKHCLDSSREMFEDRYEPSRLYDNDTFYEGGSCSLESQALRSQKTHSPGTEFRSP